MRLQKQNRCKNGRRIKWSSGHSNTQSHLWLSGTRSDPSSLRFDSLLRGLVYDCSVLDPLRTVFALVRTVGKKHDHRVGLE